MQPSFLAACSGCSGGPLRVIQLSGLNFEMPVRNIEDGHRNPADLFVPVLFPCVRGRSCARFGRASAGRSAGDQHRQYK
jgi:hypothetical protein